MHERHGRQHVSLRNKLSRYAGTIFVLVATISIAVAADFDQGKFESAGPMLLPRAKALSAVSPKSGVIGLQLGMAHNRLQNYLLNHAPLKEMTGLLNDPRMGKLVPELEKRLRAEGASLTEVRDGMLPQARSLDAEDTGLAARRDKLNENKRKLDERLAELDRQGAEHEARCLPTHPPERHDWCVENADRLNAIARQYNADVRTHNAAVDQWKKEAASLQPRWDAFVQRILNWEAKVKTLIDSIQKAFQELQDCAYLGGTSEIIHLDPLQSKITCRYNCCGREAETYHFISGKPTQEEIDFICRNPSPRCEPPPGSLK